MCDNEFERMRLTRRRMLRVAGVACGGLWWAQDARAQGVPSMAPCVIAQNWFGEAQRTRRAHDEELIRSDVRQSLNSINQTNPAARVDFHSGLASPAMAPGTGGAKVFSLPSAGRKAMVNLSPAYLPQARELLNPNNTSNDIPAGMPAQVAQGLINKLKLWPRASTVYFAFVMQARSEFLEAIRRAAREWSEISCLNIVEGTNPRTRTADIRVSFGQGLGHYSLIGTDSLQIANSVNRSERQESLNIDPSGVSDLAFLGGVSRHEFGHAIGLLHEHQHPGANIRWNRAAVERKLRAQGWDSQMIYDNVFKSLKEDHEVDASAEFDGRSIMEYWWDPSEVNGDSRVPSTPNNEISRDDRAFCSSRYGCNAPTDTNPRTDDHGNVHRTDEADVRIREAEPIPHERTKLRKSDARELEEGIARTGSFDDDLPLRLYKLRVEESGEYVIETIDGAHRLDETTNEQSTRVENGRGTPVILELHRSANDLSMKNALEISSFGSTGFLPGGGPWPEDDEEDRRGRSRRRSRHDWDDEDDEFEFRSRNSYRSRFGKLNKRLEELARFIETMEERVKTDAEWKEKYKKLKEEFGTLTDKKKVASAQSDTDDEPGSVGIADAYMQVTLTGGRWYYLLVRPVERKSRGERSFRLLLRPYGQPRPKEYSELERQSFNARVKDVTKKQDEIRTKQSRLRQ